MAVARQRRIASGHQLTSRRLSLRVRTSPITPSAPSSRQFFRALPSLGGCRAHLCAHPLCPATASLPAAVGSGSPGGKPVPQPPHRHIHQLQLRHHHHVGFSCSCTPVATSTFASGVPTTRSRAHRHPPVQHGGRQREARRGQEIWYVLRQKEHMPCNN